MAYIGTIFAYTSLELYIKAVKASIERGKREQEKREEELRNECMDIRWKQLEEQRSPRKASQNSIKKLG